MPLAPAPSALLARYIARNARYTLSVIEDAGHGLTDQQLEMALQALDFTLKDSSSWPQARDLLLALAPIMEQRGHYGVWQRFLESGLAVSQEMDDDEAEMRLRYHLGILWQHRARYEAAIEQHELALKLAQRREDRLWQARLYSRLASHRRHLRQWDKAESLLDRAQALMQAADKEEQGYVHLLRGAIHLDRREWQLAYDNFQKSLFWWQESGDKKQIAKAQANLGLVARRLQRIDEAEEHLSRAIQLLTELQDERLLAVARMNLGGMLSDYGKPEKGLILLREAEVFFRRVQDKFRLAMTVTNLGRTYYELEEWDLARSAMTMGLDLWQELDMPTKALNTLVGLAAIYARQGDVKQAQKLVQQGRVKLSGIANPQDRNFLHDAFTEVERIIEENRDRQ